VIVAALQAGVDELIVGLGGSCSTDGGAGVLRALGARIEAEDGTPVPDGGAALETIARVDTTTLAARPRHGVRLLTDVDNPLLGARGTAAVFAPQKGAGPDEVARLDRALRVWAENIGVDPDLDGTGAAGGTAYGLMAWGGRIVPGGAEIASLIGLDAAIRRADVVITGEGRFDEQTEAGKAPAVVLASAARADAEKIVIAGCIASAPRNAGALSLAEMAGSESRAMTEALTWLERAGARAAGQATRAPTDP
jgi:glycerate kinase